MNLFFVKDKKTFENIMAPGNPGILFFKYFFIKFISVLDNRDDSLSLAAI